MDAITKYQQRRKLRLDVNAYQKRKSKRIGGNVKKILDKIKQSGIINLDDEEESTKHIHGNTKIPYGLCKAAGINTEGMTPSEAWEALEGKLGITPSSIYAELKKEGTVTHITKEKVHPEEKEKEAVSSTESETKEPKPVDDGPDDKGTEPKIAFDDPESRELYKQLKAGKYLPLKELMNHPVTKKLAKKARYYKEKYGSTIEIDTPERNKLRRKIKHDFLKTGSAKVTEKDGQRKVTYDGPLKKEFKACIVIGLAASGKSSRIVEPYSEKNGAFVADCDRISEEFPEYKETNGGAANCSHKEARRLFLSTLKEFAKGKEKNGTNVVIPIIGAWMDDITDKIKFLEDNGYDVEVKYQDATPEESANRMVMRGIETGRITPLGNVEKNGDMPKKNWEEIRKWGGGKYVKP